MEVAKKRRYHNWSPDEDQIIKDNWGKFSAFLIAEKVGPGFTKNSVVSRAKHLGLPLLPKNDPLRIVRASSRAHIPWCDELDQIIRDNWGTASGSIIAGMIGHSCTRSAVVGRAHRLGLPKIEKYGSGKVVKQTLRGISRARVSKPRVPAAPRIIDAQIPFEQRKTLMQLGPNDCRWPVGDPGTADFFFCGAPKFGEQSYCASHYHRAHNYVPAERRRRNDRMTFVFGSRREAA